MGTTKIEWAERVWNPVTGCTPVSEGCENCYAKRMAKRLKAMGNQKYFYEFMPTFHPAALSEPAAWKKPCLIFVDSMGDLFHDKIFDSEIRQVWNVMKEVDWHNYMVLTKRGARAARFTVIEYERGSLLYDPLPNVALGASAENQACLIPRLYSLKQCLAAYRFLSLEPLLGFIDLDAADPDWPKYIDLVIAGGETGPGARIMRPGWVREVRDQCRRRGVPFHFKSYGTVLKKEGRILDGQEHNGAIEWRA